MRKGITRYHLYLHLLYHLHLAFSTPKACSAGPMMREPGQLNDDLIIKADELLLTDKQVHSRRLTAKRPGRPIECTACFPPQHDCSTLT